MLSVKYYKKNYRNILHDNKYYRARGTMNRIEKSLFKWWLKQKDTEIRYFSADLDFFSHYVNYGFSILRKGKKVFSAVQSFKTRRNWIEKL